MTIHVHAASPVQKGYEDIFDICRLPSCSRVTGRPSGSSRHFVLRMDLDDDHYDLSCDRDGRLWYTRASRLSVPLLLARRRISRTATKSSNEMTMQFSWTNQSYDAYHTSPKRIYNANSDQRYIGKPWIGMRRGSGEGSSP
jgi:hypothetical protein